MWHACTLVHQPSEVQTCLESRDLTCQFALASFQCKVDLQMVEISRVLRPGGVFVASTFLKTFSPLGELFGDDTVRPLNQVQPGMQSIAFMPLSLSVCLSQLTARFHDTTDILCSHMLQYDIGDCHCMNVLNEFGTCKPLCSICSCLLREASHTDGGRNRSFET